MRLKLDKLQRNELFRAIEQANLDPATFELSESRSIVLAHNPSGARLRVLRRFRFPEGLMFEVRSTLPSAKPAKSRHSSWHGVVERIAEWVAVLNQDLSYTDLWSTLVSDDARDDNSPFTANERRSIADRAASIKADAQSRYQLTDDQMTALENKLDYLVGASKRMGRLDWRNLVAGVFLEMVREAVLPQETTTSVLNHLFTAIGHMHGYPLQLGQ